MLILMNSSCQSSAKPADPALAGKKAMPETFVLEKGVLSTTLQLPGELQAFEKVDLYAKVNSFVKKILVDVGSEVKQGQLLAILEAPEINAQLNGASSRLKAAEAVHLNSKAYYNRLLETSKTPGTISPTDLDLALAREQSDAANLAAARAAYTEVNNNRDYLTIRAAFDGVISARNVNTGAYVGPAGKGSELPMFTLQQQKKLRLIIAVPEAYSGLVNQQNALTFTVRSLPGQTFEGKLVRLAGALDARLRSQHVEMDVINNDKKLLPGMVAEISLPLPASDSSFVIPETALINGAEGNYVILSRSGKAKKAEVKKGRNSGGKWEIYGQLQAGDTLVTSASEEYREGTPLLPL
ncbi:RND-type efflux pump membrane fusion protein [Flavihumibacter petaseus NBRC 106054]|uniref:RND-type efflux pump membrane fusion protein n=2 Tax=Flavihumibacter TaxID=1004301 RepID=A0A0E9N7D6_9BACT|nr:RND-type efflux pump membrane fusion protein [Flavihumibacter petaseus NBRC 106054]